ncbi:hypothetical protein I8H83_02155 [Candidatus Saccharibacteria bacterium]|nr:hypothetical protein [Candidatus Saccharibacteria bacterium]
MKDLDFDELDRAVASALSTSSPGATDSATELQPEPAGSVDAVQTPSSATRSDDAALSSISSHAVHSRLMPSAAGFARTTLVRKPASASSVTTPDSAEVTTESEPTTDAAPSQIGQAPRRTIPHREGRFMDVMRPSSSQVPRSNERAVVLQEEAQVTTEDTALPEPLASGSATNTHLEAAINELLASEGHTSTVVADASQLAESPVEMDLTPNPDIAALAAPDEESLESIAADLGNMEVPTPEAAPATSPFLADAKVEKRPLGVAGEYAVAEVEAELAPEPTVATPETENTPMPEELQSDLMAIESGETPVTTPDPIDQAAEPATKPASASTGPTSIARQYKEQPRTASEDDESGAIFDPQTYQQPIEHPAKKSSGWGWVIAIFVIILLAVAAAVAAWFGGILPVQL